LVDQQLHKNKPSPKSAKQADVSTAAESNRLRRNFYLLVVLGLLFATGLAYFSVDSVALTPTAISSIAPSKPSSSPIAATDKHILGYVGGETCAVCHRQQHDLWKGSHHDMAMQIATDKSVLGSFNHTAFTYNGITSVFFTRAGKFFINTDGPDGKLADFEVKYTFGFTPLQQYLIELPGGRLQAFGIAWDSRPIGQGGQRWFHLYPDQKLKAGANLHWTGIDQNWNYQCADCHSTNLKKNFDAASNTFHTQWSEINVSCEACHGPGSNHVSWAKQEPYTKVFSGPGKGLPRILDERRGISWLSELKTGNATRSEPRKGTAEIETCAACHSRRGQNSDTFVHGQRLADNYRPVLLDEGLYWPDGQQRDEVFTHASFLQSKMFAKGVTCSDCHEPHSLKLRAEGNGVCAQCHLPSKYDGPQHSFHVSNSKGSQCISCHMPTTTYMQVDPRSDHSLRIPRPDLSVALGTPNACNSCHTDKKPQWAAEKVQQWYPHPATGHQHYAEAFAAASKGTPSAHQALVAVAADKDQPAIARATALSRLTESRDQQTFNLLVEGLSDDNDQVRLAAVEVIARIAPMMSSQVLPPLLNDPVRGVRMGAARALAGAAEQQLKPELRASFNKALDEYIAAQQFNADRPESLTNLGSLYAERGDVSQAEVYLRRAIALAPFPAAVLNLASLYQSQGQELKSEKVLREGLARSPQEATLYHALGLALARQKRLPEAVSALAKASQLASTNLRYRYVYAVALNSSGQAETAINVLEATYKDFPLDQNVLIGLITFNRDIGRLADAKRWADILLALRPNEPGLQQLRDEQD
jgi:Flp pilus assembly protein TadD